MSTIPTSVAEDQFEHYIRPHLRVAHRGYVCRIPLYKVFNYILYRLHTGCQWEQLPIDKVATDSTQELSYHAVYHHYRKWSRDGSLARVFRHSLLSIREQLNLQHINLDGSHALAKKGGEAVAYQGRKKANTSNVLPMTDANGFILATTGIVAGNHNDAFELKDNFARFIDTSLLPAAMLYKVQKIPFDPEGLFTSLTAVMTFLLGGLTFRLSTGITGAKRQRFFLVLLLSVTGLLMALVEPINKNLWTLSYVLLTGAAGVLLLAALEKINDREPNLLYRLSIPFASMGRNPLMIYVLSGIVGKGLALWKTGSGVSLKAILFNSMLVLPVSAKTASVLYSLILLGLLALLAARMRGLSFVIR